LWSSGNTEIEPNRRLKEIRPIGSCTSTPPSELHREGGGNHGAVVFCNVRAGDRDPLFEMFDAGLKVVGSFEHGGFHGRTRRIEEIPKPIEQNRLAAS
jgi:hypothetical protein